MKETLNRSTAVSCRGLCKRFAQGEHSVMGLDRVDLDVKPGELLCLSGPSGSGKTTLLNAIGGLDRVDEGDIEISDRHLSSMSSRQLADMRLNHIGFVFQSYNLIPVLSARENVEFILQLQGQSEAQRRKVAMQVLQEVGLAGMAERRPDQLSGGQQQRVAVARAIASRPRLVLADEPTANLDSHTAEQLMDLFVSLNKNHGTTFIIATHDQRVMAYAKRQIIMRDGKIVEDKTH
ncbi:ABC transporter ATP-binding protein [Aestuariirhabdus sp. Z084]|uniref:ABC transporter ATP-binding protein n=1 Tax=Aestuariirhabdus haliotis TaxID=2918751 RepID=UPI00201B3DFC|nr:ABC transporter ATP-binding protein [Aestuariirhabdus haliotis]MCL6414040.1 ABC transporter ATP-binding protein [Aestuariirhabdus haliotis]MCL6417973.1 ABC transporter ATP-binding protein [Aestuariirhabdus haliotis]